MRTPPRVRHRAHGRCIHTFNAFATGDRHRCALKDRRFEPLGSGWAGRGSESVSFRRVRDVWEGRFRRTRGGVCSLGLHLLSCPKYRRRILGGRVAARCCDDVPSNPLPATGRHVGVDVGVASFATTSDGEHIDNPRWGRVAADRLSAAQQRLQRAKRKSKNRVDLQIANMVRRAKPVPDPDNPGQFLANGARAKSGLSRSISDAGWGQFVSIPRAKAEDAGRTLIEVDPRHTSDGCESCGLDWPFTPKRREKKPAASSRWRSHHQTNRAISSATAAGLSAPSISTVCRTVRFTVSSPTLVASARSDRTRTRLPAVTGARKRTLFSP
jgi:hypothetical protein